MVAQPLSIQVVADDRRLLRRLSAFLAVFGYDVHQAAGPHQAAAAVAARRPDCIVIDAGRSLGETLRWCSQIVDQGRREHVHTLLAVDESSPGALTEALEAGVDDFLARPIVYGEVLARLRAAARTIEFERRLGQQSNIEPVTGLPSRAAVHRRLERLAGGSAPVGCAVLDVDFLAGINARWGHPAGDALLGVIAQKLIELGQSAELVASPGAGQFCAVFVGQTEDQVVQWADQARASLTEIEWAPGQPPVSLTLSGGVVVVGGEEVSVETILHRAEEALRSAKQSGRDLVARHGQFIDEARAWKDLIALGKLFEGTIARDIMTPCPLVLRPDDSSARAAALLGQTALGALPVVDTGGKLVGLLSDAGLLAGSGGGEGASNRVGDLMTPNPPARDEETTFDELMRLFQDEPATTLVIVHHDQPTGLVTANNLLALSSPVTAETFRPSTPFSLGSDYLVIPDLSPADPA
ncbi:MAG: diguanylate cyclase [Pirellulales bacterium]|nr:diguanylate cyclase [Pirellulales bacterium]